MRSRSGARRGPLVYLRDRRLALILALAVLAGFLAYQAPPVSDIFVGWLGDRLFLPASQGLGEDDAATFYSDEITGDARSGRSRWTRQDARLDLPGLGASGALTLTLRAQGWPDDVINSDTIQPLVTVTANGVQVGQFTPTARWADYSFRIPKSAGTRDALALTLHTLDTFTSTRTIEDSARPKGIRLEYVGVRGSEPLSGMILPAPLPIGLLVVDGALCLLALVVLTRRPTLAFVLTTLLISGAAIALALARLWAAALLPWSTGALALLLIYSRRAALLILFEKLLHRYARGAALNYGLVAMVATWLAYLVARASAVYKLPGLKTFKDSFPDSLLYGLLGMGLLLLILVRGGEGLPRLSNALVRAYGSRRGGLALLVAVMLIWIGYEAYVVAGMPYVGHADYADNAVVARNLVAGRGWVVDYVTQFYKLYGGVTRPQETWPLLQPVWIAPFFALFGPTAWAAKIPNLLFMVALALLIYAAGARLWDRRVGLTAALVVLTSYLYFRLSIYVTSDLAFTVFAFGAVYLLYLETQVASRRSQVAGRKTHDDRQFARRGSRLTLRVPVLSSSVLTGLMMLQKPASGVLIAFGMGLWFLARAWRGRISNPASLMPVAAWSLIALLILSPYVVRNLVLFHTPFYSTESLDAWVLGYADDEAIYKVYTPQADLSETGGLPDKTWPLRWGFDRTGLKLVTQLRAVRDYLAPPAVGLPLGLSDILAGKQRKALLFEMGAWLALLGAVGVLRTQRQLLTLLLFAFGPHILFLITYWHANEERYFVTMMPWLALLAGYALWRGYDRIAAIGDGRWAPAGLALAITALVMVIQSSWPDIANKVRAEPQVLAADLAAYAWLREHTAPDDVVMTRVPWQLNWASERPALMVPNTASREVFLRLARYYRVRYLVRDTWQQPSREAIGLISSLIGDGTLKEIHRTATYPTREGPLTTVIYSLPATYGGVAELRP